MKSAESTVRRLRFGHVDFGDPFPHPFAPEVRLRCFPVLPAAYLEAPAAEALLGLYDDLIDVAVHGPARGIPEAVAAVANYLTPVVLEMCRWRLSECTIFARGLALERRV